MENKKNKTKESGERKMTIERARSLSPGEYASLDARYGGFNSETYNNHQTHKHKETTLEFIDKGSDKIKGIRLLKNTD